MKKIFVVISTLFVITTLYAHTLLMNVMNNEDNTITVIGEFSTGEKAAGALVRLESLVSGEILFKQRLPVESELTIDIPKEPYQVVLDGGPGHTIVKEGIEPLEGFAKEVKEKAKSNSEKLSKAENFNNEWSLTTIILFTICIVLLLLALYFSSRNTNKILNEIRQKN
ncbi:hypothetical protein CP965_05340 [Halarcobacter mediterraneus]|uniref:Uncharacterized protein n=1 Tax=Halarcobacter mediterraneus TaxID=2023153 RepID=A0A4V1M1C9_9BACT|nr:hypothetical protein [Halarcobacter mediterraneus]RXK13224.1 hypothetical protein CP965_05340 [Halarcobacter mediterraneus]